MLRYASGPPSIDMPRQNRRERRFRNTSSQDSAVCRVVPGAGAWVWGSTESGLMKGVDDRSAADWPVRISRLPPDRPIRTLSERNVHGVSPFSNRPRRSPHAGARRVSLDIPNRGTGKHFRLERQKGTIANPFRHPGYSKQGDDHRTVAHGGGLEKPGLLEGQSQEQKDGGDGGLAQFNSHIE